MYSLAIGFFFIITVGYDLEISSIKNEYLNTRRVYFRLSVIEGSYPNSLQISKID